MLHPDSGTKTERWPKHRWEIGKFLKKRAGNNYTGSTRDLEEENTFLGCTVHLSNTEPVVGVSATDAKVKAAENGTEATLWSAGEVTVELQTGWQLISVTGTTAEGRMELVVTAALLTALTLDLFNKITFSQQKTRFNNDTKINRCR